MRKLLCVVLSIVMVLATCVCSFSAVKPDDGAISPQYVSTDRVSSDTAISGSIAAYYAKFAPKARRY